MSPSTIVSGAKHLAYQIVPPIEPLESLVRAALPRWIVATVLLCALALLARPLWKLRRDVALRAGVVWLVANLLPVVTLPISLSTPMNDRLLYLPGFGMVFIVAALLRRIQPRALIASAAVLCSVAAVWSWTMSERWVHAGIVSNRILTALADRVRTESG